MRSLLRILIATLAALAILLGLAAAAITQPAFGTLPAPGGPAADPDRLRRHVEFLTVRTAPRDSDHPESLDRAAAYIRESFGHARVRDQVFQVRGRSYRNVIASFGPATGPLVVVGAHYGTFGDFGPNPGADDNASGTAGLLRNPHYHAPGDTAETLDYRRMAGVVEGVANSVIRADRVSEAP